MKYPGKHLIGIGHQIITTDEAEDGDDVVIINYSEGTKDFVKCRAIGRHIVYHQHVLLTYHRTDLFIHRHCKDFIDII